MNEPPLLEIRNATVWRGATRVFDDFSLSIKQHERVAIVGPNGAGKTTLLKLISRELYPVAQPGSSVRVLGRDRWNVWELREHIGIVSSELQSGFMPQATVFETVVSGFFSSIGIHAQLHEHIRPEQMHKSDEVIGLLGLHEIRDRAFETLSTGQQRRCLLGRALVHDPDVLVLDEPMSGLDLSAGFDFLRRIREQALQGKSLVVVTHHLSEIPPEVERVIVLKEGRIRADGRKLDVLTSEVLSDAYGTPLRVAIHEGYLGVYPSDSP